ncbi:MAG TPA: hypothetical protein VF265_07755 [Nevskiaceae bacterium]
MLNCAGCHRPDGKGVSDKGIPDLRNSLALFTLIPAGRDYLVRVPGSAEAQVDDAELARLLNWMVVRFGPDHVLGGFRPYTTAEVAAIRGDHYADVAQVRRELGEALAERSYEVSPYTYGK